MTKILMSTRRRQPQATGALFKWAGIDCAFRPYSEFIGEKKGTVTVVDIIKGQQVKFLCQCECGNVFQSTIGSWYHNKVKCHSRSGHIDKSIVGSIFGRLEIIDVFYRQRSGKKKSLIKCYRCKCECGSTTEIQVAHWGSTKSCGCLYWPLFKATGISSSYIKKTFGFDGKFVAKLMRNGVADEESFRLISKMSTNQKNALLKQIDPSYIRLQDTNPEDRLALPNYEKKITIRFDEHRLIRERTFRRYMRNI